MNAQSNMNSFFFDTRSFAFSLKLMAVIIFLCAGAYATVLAVGKNTFNEDAQAHEEARALDAPLVEEVRATIERRANLDTKGPFSSAIRYTTAADYMPRTGPYIVVDLKTHMVTTYLDTNVVGTYEVLRSSVAGSPFALKQGLYAVRSQTERRASNVGNVYLPFDIEFYDGMSIHGVPVQDEGEEVEESYAGDRVRIATEHARELFSFATSGVPVFVYDGPPEDSLRSVLPIEIARINAPAVSARSFVIADVITGDVYLAKNADKVYPIASITKLMTAIVASDLGTFDQPIQVEGGEHYEGGDLYYPLLLRSHNGVAEAYALAQGQRMFYARMNNTARAIGMYHSNFADASGISPQSRATGDDLLALSRYLYEKRRFILDMSREKEMTITSRDGDTWSMKNQNVLARDANFLGGKLGYTDEALQTSLALFMVPVADEARTVAVIVLGSHDWKQDTRTLVTWFSENAILKGHHKENR